MDAALKAFGYAVQKGDDDSAIALMSSGHVPVHSRIVGKDGFSVPILFETINYSRQAVFRCLVEHGADLDELLPGFRILSNQGMSFSAVGYSIFVDDPAFLLLGHELGASLSAVGKESANVPAVSAVSVAILFARSRCLISLLDKVPYDVSSLQYDGEILYKVALAAGRGKPAIEIYKVLKARQFNFKLLEIQKISFAKVDAQSSSMADLMIKNAQRSGHTPLLRYIVKDLGLVSQGARLEAVEAGTREILKVAKMLAGKPAFVPEADASKYRCVSCDKVGATSSCSRCKVTRYCSKACQRTHWLDRGHKEDCKKIMRGAGCS